MGGCEPRIEGIASFKNGVGGCEPRIEGIVQFKMKRWGGGVEGTEGEDVNQQPSQVKKALKI